MNFRNILIGVLIGSASLAGGAYVGDTQRAKIDGENASALLQAQRFQEAINGQRDVAALAIRECGRLEMVIFFKANGESDGIIIDANTESRLNGLAARAKRLQPKHIYTAHLARLCGAKL